jgi:hypothetical protein
MEPIAYDCIGCKKCWGADATIQLANHFEEVQIDSCACGDEHTGGASTVVTVSVIVRRLLPTFAFVPVGGGTVTEDFQGESAFDPASVNPPTPPGDIQTSPQHGVWQKTDWKTFAATLVAIQAENDDDWNKLYARVKNNIEPGTDKVEYFRRWYPAFRHEAEGLAA